MRQHPSHQVGSRCAARTTRRERISGMSGSERALLEFSSGQLSSPGPAEIRSRVPEPYTRVSRQLPLPLGDRPVISAVVRDAV